MKNSISKIIVLFTIITSLSLNAQNYCSSNPVDVHGSLNVSGNKIVDQNNSLVSFAGNSFFWSNTHFGAERFYNADVVSTLKNDWGSTIVRAAMGVEDFGGFLTYPDANRERVRTVVDAAIAEGLYVIIDWHSHHAENYRQNAIDFFKEMATIYGNHPNIIYEIYNEPINSSWSNDIKPYAEAVISEIRAIDPDNLIIVGTPFFSQEVDVASNDPITSSTNIAYTLHFYAGTHGASLRARAQTALNNGIPLFVTEWGTVNANGDGGVDNNSTDEWMSFLAENDISHLNWSVHDKDEGASILRPGAPSNGNWSDANLTESGLRVRSIIENWQQYCNGESIVIEEEEELEYVNIPSLIQAENYVSQSGTQTENTSDINGGENVGFIDTNDSLSYNIAVSNTGNYNIDFRVASRQNGTSFDIYLDNNNIGSLSSPATGGWQIWETISTNISLTEGNHTFRLVATGTGWNINWIDFSEANEQGNNTEVSTNNLALNGTASQSSTAHLGSAERAIDGNTNGFYSGDSVTHTSSLTGSSWQVNLRAQSDIQEIVIYNRTDSCCRTRLSNFTVSILDENENEIFSQSITTTPTPSTTINVSGISGRIVRVTNNLNNTPLSLAEVEVYGTETGDTTNTNSNDSYVIRARGVSGSEQISLIVDGTTVDTFSLSTSWEEYTTTSTLNGNARIEFVNDAIGRDLEVDYLQKNGITFQAEDQAINTSVYQNGSCGGSFSEEMHCPGYIEFANTISARSSLADVNDISDSIKIYQNASDNLVVFTGDTEGFNDISLYDVQGRLVLKESLNSNQSEISMSSLTQGVYFVRLSGSKIYTQTILKK